MKISGAVALLGAVLAAPAAWGGGDAAGTAAATFLSQGTGPGVLAMGGAAIGRNGSLDLASWNPASLAFLHETSVLLAHANLDDQSAQEWAGAGGRFGRSRTAWGLGALYQNEGTFEGRDASNVATGSFTVASAAGIVQLAQGLGPYVSIGVAGKYVLDSQGPAAKGTGVTMDAGLSVRAGMIGFGVTAQNAIGRMSYGDLRYPFPASYGAGLSFVHPSGVTVALDYNAPNTAYANVRGGIEWRWKQLAALRAGYRAELGAPSEEALSGPSFGTGFGTHGAWLDYGFLLSGNQGGQHRLALSFRLPDLSLGSSDPFGQSSIPRSFDDPRYAGPPVPDTLGKPAKNSAAAEPRH